MKEKVRSSALAMLLLLLFSCGYAQDLDLIVTARGDSIACRIDSISDTYIYFEMKSQNKWAFTHITHADVTEYKRYAINEKQYKYESGTSIIKSRIESVTSLKDLPRNSLYLGILSVNYSRLFTGKRVGVTVAGGLSFVTALDGKTIGYMLESTLLTGGGTKHFFEPGIMGYYESDNDFSILVRIGYRYQSPGGFLFRTGALVNNLDGLGLLPALSLGYSF